MPSNNRRYHQPALPANFSKFCNKIKVSFFRPALRNPARPARSVRSQLELLLLFCILLPASVGRAGPVDEIRLGVLYHDLGLWAESRNEGGVDFNAELIFSPSLELLSGVLRPNLGFSLNSGGATSKIYGGAMWEYRWPRGYFVDLALGLAVHNGETDKGEAATLNQLGSPVLFRLAFEAGVTIGQRHLISLMFDHVSNAYLAEPNEGLDTLGLRYGYRF